MDLQKEYNRHRTISIGKFTTREDSQDTKKNRREEDSTKEPFYFNLMSSDSDVRNDDGLV